MKNIENAVLSTCIILEEIKFEQIIQRIWGKEYELGYSSCNVYIQDNKYSLNNDEVFQKLSEYFGVSRVCEVWYIAETRTVWIAYEE